MPRTRQVILLLVGLTLAGALIYLKHLQGEPSASPDAETGLAPSSAAGPPGGAPDQDVIGRFRALQAQERELNRTIWADEMLAREHEQVFIEMWDAMRSSARPLSVLSGVQFDTLSIGTPGVPVPHENQIVTQVLGGHVRSLSSANWKALLEEFEADGFSLVESEWRMTGFEKQRERGATSKLAVTLHAANAGEGARYILQGELDVVWRKRDDRASPPRIESVDARGLVLKKRSGGPPFEKAVERALRITPESVRLEPVVILYDLDRDGLSEIVVATSNLVLRNLGGLAFEAAPLVQDGFRAIMTGLIADFTGDGRADFLGVDENGLLLWPGSEGGGFRGSPRRAWLTQGEPVFNAYGISAGDVDGDRDLDVWLGQYKVPYQAGQMPTPYFDANDGFPSFLLANDGKGGFGDVTQESGIAGKRFRRNYSGSLADLDADADLDLVTLNDFAGIDIFENDGTGKFADVTETVVDQRHLFGMSHALGDFNLDGALDIFAVGMTSNFADRLDQMGLGRPEFSDYHEMRASMRYGNRLYFGGAGKFAQLPMGADVRDAGWAWGATAFDFDNDGDQDLYAVNGHITRATARDYDAEFWTHDIYAADSKLDPAAMLLFRAKARQRHIDGVSHGGNHTNKLFINEGGRSFLEAAFLMDVAVLRDCRNVLAEDLDGDGRLDLIVTLFEKWPRDRQQLQIFRNVGAFDGNWIGFRFDEADPETSPFGARIDVVTASGRQFRQIVAGDSYRVQGSLNVHFGLGAARSVRSVEIRWPDREITRVEAPEINAWHRVSR